MAIRTHHILAPLALMVALHTVANVTGLYDQPIVWVDKPLHILAGTAVMMLWIRLGANHDSAPKHLAILAALGFVALVALGWEILEYGFATSLPQWAVQLNWSSPGSVDGERLGIQAAGWVASS